MKKALFAPFIVTLAVISLLGLSRLCLATEEAGRQAEQAGKLGQALTHYVAALQADENNRQLRIKIIQLAQKMQPPPPVPEQATRHMVRGEAFVELASDKNGFLKAASEFQKAANEAPWLAAAYYNLGVVQDKAGQHQKAMRALELYLLAAPDASDARDVRNLIYKIEVRKEAAHSADSESKGPSVDEFAGRWRTNFQNRTTHRLMDIIPQKRGNVVKYSFKLGGGGFERWDKAKQKLVEYEPDWSAASYYQYQIRNNTIVLRKYDDNGCGPDNEHIIEITLKGQLQADTVLKYTNGYLPGIGTQCDPLQTKEKWFRP